MTGSVVEQLVPTPLEMNSSSSEAGDFEAQRIGVASAVALLSGIIMVKQMHKVCGFTAMADLSFCYDTNHNYMLISLCPSSVCLVFSWASSPPICQSQLLRLSPALLPSMSPSHSCKICWGCGSLATLGPSPSSRWAAFHDDGLIQYVVIWCCLLTAHWLVCSDFRVSDGEPASHQHGGAAHLLGVFGCSGAS